MGRGFRIFTGLILFLTLLSVSGLALLFLGTGLFFQVQPDSFSHTVEYSATYQTNGTTADTVMLLPYPDTPEFREALQGNNSEVEKPEGWNLSFVETDRGSMMRVEADLVESEKRPSARDFETNESVPRGDQLRYYREHQINIKIDYNTSLDTRTALDTEPHLEPRISPTRVNCHYTAECYATNTTAFLKQDADNQTYTYLGVSLDGRNEWFAMGWTGNSYRQNFQTGADTRIKGSQNRWLELKGTEEQAVGNYRD